MEMRKRRMVRMPNRDGEEEGSIMNPDSSAGVYVTVSVEAQCRLIAQKRKMKEEEKIKNTNVNALKRAAHVNMFLQRPLRPLSTLVSLRERALRDVTSTTT